LINAFTKVASERGYGRTAVEDVAAAAGLPERVFYEHFENVRQCLSAAHDSFFGRLIDETARGVDERHEWPVRVKEAVTSMLEFIGETATRARFFTVEALAAGPLILERQAAELERVVPMLREGREHSREAADLPALTESILVGGAAYLVRGALLIEGPLPVERLETELVEVLLTPYLGSREASRIAR
jgi:AcrR family transcriptional regulator